MIAMNIDIVSNSAFACILGKLVELFLCVFLRHCNQW